MESTMKLALAWLLTYAIHSTAMLAIAWMLSRWARLSTHTLDFVWKLALVGGLLTSSAQLLLGVRPTGSFALQSREQTRQQPARTYDAPTRAADPEPVVARSAAGSTDNPVAPRTETNATFPVPPASDVTTALAMVERALVIGWALVALVLALSYTARRLMLVGRLANRQHITDGTLPAILDALCRSVGFRTPIALTSVNTISSPVALGLHEICVPDAVLTELSVDEQRGLLAHELAHLARRDPVWLDVVSLTERVFFFQPLNRLARREIQRNAEFLCDDWAAERTGTGLPLAHCLARVAEWIEARPLGVPVAGMAEQRSLLVTRIARLIEGKRSGSPLSRALTFVTASVLLSVVVAAAPTVSGRVSGRVATGDAELLAPLDSKSDTRNSASRESGVALDTPAASQSQAAEIAAAAANRGATRHEILDTAHGDATGASHVEDPAVIAALIERLKDSDAGVRRAAAHALGNLRSRTAVPALIAAIGDRNTDVRLAVCEALGSIGDPRAVAALSRLLEDQNPNIRSHALDALGEFADELTATDISPLAADPRAETRAKVAELLGEIGDRETIGILKHLVGDPSAEVRQQSIESLGKMREPSVGATLMPGLRDPIAEVRVAALEALSQLNVLVAARDIATLLVDPSAEVRRSALQYLTEQPTLATVTAIRPMLDDADEEVREQAVEVLAELRSPEARAALRAALTSRDPKVRRRAAEALGDRP
ncbi:MAG: HEAT repeat domain-containing protein [Gemmatimonadaceae bacterium]|jgi:HEAT repeat protein/beta-lactamase regulating signal transducer with metallopeptidase domain|nr:HEAT repeat domain-containing protein [Gemmatimonadaceae bacterium]MCC6431009.1 HEAT repeat domain-containing protein [Gemmatimonadaceae bacterium]